MFKTVLNDGQGSEHIASFHLPGELFGLDALHQNSHPSSVIALGTSSLCAIKYLKLERLALQIPGLQHHLL
ncbi:cyclic nucleotide-binding domain-containing protein, partial [Oleiphilus sp. HI0066]|uniref:cyclic nucleotide-binding domain-containing protein n=1 Tax=Oleiphilus sp. HI0066 TaxID=1822242 RepID=UPI000A49FED0